MLKTHKDNIQSAYNIFSDGAQIRAMALKKLTTYKWIIEGNGQVRPV